MMDMRVVYGDGTTGHIDHMRFHKKDGGLIVEDFRTHILNCAKCREVIGSRQLKEDTAVTTTNMTELLVDSEYAEVIGFIHNDQIRRSFALGIEEGEKKKSSSRG
jgi:hypothetical protein